jgi:hypothetical protein
VSAPPIKRGRKRADAWDKLDRAVEVIRLDPSVTADELQRAIRVRRSDARRILSALHRLDPVRITGLRPPGRPKRVLNPCGVREAEPGDADSNGSER